MTDFDTNIASMHERLASIRNDVDDTFSTMFGDLDKLLNSIEQLKSDGVDNGKRVKQLEERAEGQSELIETLTKEAEEARSLRAEAREQDLEIERLKSELESKNDLVKALRRKSEDSEQSKSKQKQQDKKIFEQQHELDRKQRELDRAKSRINELKQELEAEHQRAAEQTGIESSEMVSLKAELDARKSMIKSLKADGERVDSLEAQLEAKQEAVDALEQAIDQHAATIEGLRRSVEAWKEKYQAVKGEKIQDIDETMTELPEFTDTELEALRQLEATNQGGPESTVAINMSDSLKQARKAKARAN